MPRLKKNEIKLTVGHAVGAEWVEISFWASRIGRRAYFDITPSRNGFRDKAAAQRFADSVKIVRKK